ncbi:hypothetical protein [Pontibacillus marinus]|uniref:Uncharacterized protein n=1 Tax=Pontibacillus marinus BH030004 = DSM 16465 TaxID=1385511 RepID=A0A0A5FUV6_9BACI|nr:hypothetical protein [Pontibacillus marinus]KGX83694.1 hypothetical protein N783_01570 [Pontibacillus marinus BH030004 = DSM 16465]
MKQFNPKWLLVGLVGVAITVLLILFLSGFFVSEKQAMQNAKSAAKEAFNKEEVPFTKELESISLYMPKTMKIVSNSANNLILREDEQGYILFYNPFEKLKSDTFYKDAKKAKDIELIETFRNEERFGYIRVIKLDEETYELQVGVGGVRMTTETDKNDLKEDAHEMMKIVRSIAYSTIETTKSK